MANETLRFARALVSTNLKASLALRGAFWLQVIFMIANNAIYFSIWFIFFDRFEEIRGWRLGDVGALYGIVATSFGLCVVFAGGVRELARMIIDGDLDSFMTQPKNLLLHTLGSRTFASGWGDIASGLLFLALSGVAHWRELPLVIVAIIASTIVFLSTGVVLHCSAFWLGRIDGIARQIWEFLITFSLYPRTLFTGALKFMLFTVVPAGFIGYLPVGLLQQFRWIDLAAVVAGAAAYAGLALLVFARGLRRYESGNRFGQRA